jgi:hypothetical protein
MTRPTPDTPPFPFRVAEPVRGSAPRLKELACRLEQRNWSCELTGAGAADTALRATAPVADEPSIAVVVIRDRGAGPYFAHARTPHRPIAGVDELDRTIRALELVHCGASPPAPYIPPGLAAFAAAFADESP